MNTYEVDVKVNILAQEVRVTVTVEAEDVYDACLKAEDKALQLIRVGTVKTKIIG